MARAIDADALIERFRPYLHTDEAIPADVVIEDIRSMPTLTPPNESLTLEQLREMGGKPYWHVGLQTGSPKPRWKILDPFVARRPEDYGYGKRWVAYAYPPAHIDREAWEPCKLCGGAKYVYGYASSVVPNGDKGKIETEVEGDFDYCPECGRPLTPEAWAMLEKRLMGLQNG